MVDTNPESKYVYIDEGDNHHPTILKEIRHIKFPSLKLLNLGKNSIASIEGIESLIMPQLEELYLCKNVIMKGKTTSSASGA